MNLSFIHPAILFLLPLAAIPLLLHLFAKSRPPIFRFPSIEFIRRAQRNTMRIKKPKDRLLLLLRTLLMLALLGLFLRPVIHLPGAGPTASNRTICLLIDATASMGAADSGQTRFAHACAEASEALRDLSADDKVNLIWLRAEPDAVFPQPGINISLLQSELREAVPTFEAGDPLTALTLATDMLQQETESEKSIYIISDFQQTVWETVKWTPPEGIKLVVIPVANLPVANTAVIGLSCVPSKPLPDEPVTITATIANFSSRPVQQTVYLSVGAQRLSWDVSLPASNRMPVAFSVQVPRQTVLAECSIADDLFPADNRRQTLIQPGARLRVALYDAAPETARAWSRVIHALNRVEWVRVQNLELIEPCDLLLLAGWDGITHRETISRLLNEAIPVIWYPSSPLPVDALPFWFGTEPATPLRMTGSHTEKALQISLPEHHLFSLFRDGTHGDPARARFSSILPLPAFPADHELLMSYSDQTPALLKHESQPLYLWNIPLDRQYTKWPLHEEFFILFAELLLLEHRTCAGIQPIYYPGHPLTLALDTSINIRDLRLDNAEGLEIQIKKADHLNETAHSIPIADPGNYTWYYKDTPLLTQCVNFPEIESDLTPSTPEGILEKSGVVVGSGVQVRRLREGIELWSYFLWAALLFILLELLTAWRVER